jgi:hypothetical protein
MGDIWLRVERSLSNEIDTTTIETMTTVMSSLIIVFVVIACSERQYFLRECALHTVST